MNPWILVLLVMAAIVFGLDYLVRRKSWKRNSGLEKVSLLLNMFSVGPYIFLSALGLLWGIVSYSPESAAGQAVYDATLFMGETYFVVALAAVIVSFILRKKEKAKASIWVNVIALLYIALVLGVNSLVGKIM